MNGGVEVPGCPTPMSIEAAVKLLEGGLKRGI